MIDSHDFSGSSFFVCIEYAIRKVQETRLGLDIEGNHEVLACADDVNVIGDDIRTRILV